MSSSPRPRVGVVTLAHGRHDHLAGQHRSLAVGDRLPDRYVVVAMDDPALAPADVAGLRREVVHVPAHPDGLPLAAARNAGVRALAGATGDPVDVVVLLDVDCLAGPGLVAAYADAVTGHRDVVWSGPVTYLPPPPPGGYDLGRLAEVDDPHPGRPAPAPGELVRSEEPDLFWSLSFATTPAAWAAAGGFDEGYTGYGAEDTDFGRRVVAAGLGHGWVGGARAYHQHHPVSRPPVEHVDDILRNGARFAARWGEWPMRGWLEEMERMGIIERHGDSWARTLEESRG